MGIDPNAIYTLFDEEVNGEFILEYNFDYLPYVHQILVANTIKRSKEILFTFHPDITESLMGDKENSIYYKKTPKDIQSIYRRESTKSIRKTEEFKTLQKNINTQDQVVKNRRSKAIKVLTELGYDRIVVRNKLQEMIDENGSGILGLSSGRIAEIVDEEMQSDFDERRKHTMAINNSARS